MNRVLFSVMRPWSRHLIGLLVLVQLVLLSLHTHSAEVVTTAEDPARQVHWAMGAFFGTGWYRVDNNRNVYILRVPPSQTLRESSINANGERTLGIEIQYPVSFGMHNLDTLDDFLDFDNYATVSFTPGVQVEIPVTEKWYLRPYANIGWGTEMKSSDTAWIFYGGIKSRYRLGGDQADWSLLNAIHYAGYNPDAGSRGKYGSFMTGLEFDHPLNGLSLGGDDLWLNWHVTYNYMFDELNFHVEDNQVESIRDQWELGLALGKGSKKMKFWFLKFEHVGLSFKTSSNGVYKAISVNMRSPFTM
jgi:hypothetical protein